MSTEHAIVTVTRTLRLILEKEVPQKMGITTDVMQPLVVETFAPHKVRELRKDENVLNLYLYKTEVNAAWRNQSLPAMGKSGPPPLAINLEYLVCAYGEGDREDIAHFYLGAAMRVLHDCTVVPRARLAAEVEGKGLVHQQIENIRVSPRPMSVEELSKLWSVLGTPYRISAAYEVTVLLIESKTPASSGPPVLRRGPDDRGPVAITTPPPALLHAKPATNFPAVRFDEDLVLTGEHLGGGTADAFVRHPLLADAIQLPVSIVSDTEARIHIPPLGGGVASKWPAGIWTVSLVVTRPNQPKWTTNEVPFALAPAVTIAPTANNTPNTDFELTITAFPQVRAGQKALVLWDAQQLVPKSIATAAGVDTPTVVKIDVQGDVGPHRVRLRVDGVDSIPVRIVNGLMEFDPNQSVEVSP